MYLLSYSSLLNSLQVNRLMAQFPISESSDIDLFLKTPQKIAGEVTLRGGDRPLISPASPNCPCVYFRVEALEQVRIVTAVTGGALEDGRHRFEVRYCWEHRYVREEKLNFLLQTGSKQLVVPLCDVSHLKIATNTRYKNDTSARGPKVFCSAVSIYTGYNSVIYWCFLYRRCIYAS
jgi:hypothetical protein